LSPIEVGLSCGWRLSGFDAQPRVRFPDLVQLRLDISGNDERGDQLGAAGWGPAMVVADKRNCPPVAASVADALGDDSPGESIATQRESLAGRVEAVYWPGFSLAQVIRLGVGYHHADLDPSILAGIVEALDSGVLRAVVATTTLAEGVNLPFRLVVFHSTHVGGGLSALLYRNIIGRAARAFRATEGFAIFIATDRATPRWLARRFWEPGRPALSVTSPSLRALDDRSVPGRHAQLLLESQLMGHIADATVDETDEGMKIASRTLASVTSPQLIGGLTQRIEDRLGALTDSPVAVMERESPLRLTGFGKACLRTGLSFRACEFFRRRIAEVEDAGATWLTVLRDPDNELTEDSVRFLMGITLRSPDLYLESIEFNRIRGESDDRNWLGRS
jgi:replicative superfamily II helicase